MSFALRIFSSPAALALAAAKAVAENIHSTLETQDGFSLVLAGGNTPRLLYSALVSEYGGSIPWERVQLFWSDERYVPHDHPRSNYRFIRETFLDYIRIPSENVHAMDTSLPNPDDSAQAYETMLRARFLSGGPRFDLVLLGMGIDGHTASIFPGSSAITESQRWVVAVHAPAQPPQRLTLTMAALLQSARVHFLVAGQDKAPALADAVAGSRDGTPAARIFHATDGDLVAWVDEAAAASLRSRSVERQRRRGHGE